MSMQNSPLSLVTRSLAQLVKSEYRPSGVIASGTEPPFPLVPGPTKASFVEANCKPLASTPRPGKSKIAPAQTAMGNGQPFTFEGLLNFISMAHILSHGMKIFLFLPLKVKLSCSSFARQIRFQASNSSQAGS
jgi:hypothetical protein